MSSEAFFIHPAAQEEFHDALVYYATRDDSGELALDFADTFQDCLDGILAHPLSYQIRRLGIRQANLKPRFPEYHIAYTIRQTKVVVLALGHDKKRPNYWRARN